jgi:hypothetical protein
MELTVAMLISAIVIAITYTAYQLISNYYNDYHKKQEEIAVLIRLDELLRRDFEKAQNIELTPEGYQFTLQPQPVTYHFTPEGALRISTVTDTFKVTLNQVQAGFEGQPISADNLNNNDPEAGRIDALAFRVLYRTETFPYHYHKTYSSENLINRKAHAFH